MRREKVVGLDEFDDAARALFAHSTGQSPESLAVSIENDRWWVLARVALEGAGLTIREQ